MSFDALGLSEEIVNQYRDAAAEAKAKEEVAKEEFDVAMAGVDVAKENGDLERIKIKCNACQSASETHSKSKKVAKFYAKLYESAKNNGKWVEVDIGGTLVKVQVLPDVAGINLARDRELAEDYGGQGADGRFVLFIHGEDGDEGVGLLDGTRHRYVTAENMAKFVRTIPTYKGQDVLLVACASANTPLHVNFTVSIDAQVKAPKTTTVKLTLTNPAKAWSLHMPGWKPDTLRHLSPAPGTSDWVNLTVEQAKKMQKKEE